MNRPTPRQRSAPARVTNALFREARVLVCDGGTGTMLQGAGVSLDLSLPELSVSRPELVRAVHGAYVAAGADVIETNTFGACRTRLARHGLEHRVAEINLAAARVAREAVAASGRAVLIAGSIGPASARSRLAAPALREAFEEQIAALQEGGVDFLLLETFGALDEAKEAIAAAKAIAVRLPIVAQMTFLDDGRTLSGETPAEVARQLDASGLAGLGANCTLGPQGLLAIIEQLARGSDLPLCAQPNAGAPTFVDGRFQYTADPAYFARYAARYAESGALLVGGCCGTTPAHIEAVADAVRGLTPAVRPAHQTPAALRAAATSDAPAIVSSSLLERIAAGRFVVVAELSLPTGGATEQAVLDAGRLEEANCDAVLIAPPSSARAQVSPTSLAVLVQQRLLRTEAMLTVATWEKSVMALQADLLGAHAFGVRHVVCRTGTPPLLGDYPNTGGIWDVDSVGLIELLQGLNRGHDRHGIPLANPTSFIIGARINPSADDLPREIADAQRKVEAGVHFFITPPVYDLDALDWLLDAAGVPAGIPVLLGVMPLRDYPHAEYLQHEVPGMSLPAALLNRMWRVRDEDAGATGLEIAAEIIEQARQRGRVQGVVLSSAIGMVDDVAGFLEELPLSTTG